MRVFVEFVHDLPQRPIVIIKHGYRAIFAPVARATFKNVNIYFNKRFLDASALRPFYHKNRFRKTRSTGCFPPEQFVNHPRTTTITRPGRRRSISWRASSSHCTGTVNVTSNSSSIHIERQTFETPKKWHRQICVLLFQLSSDFKFEFIKPITKLHTYHLCAILFRFSSHIVFSWLAITVLSVSRIIIILHRIDELFRSQFHRPQLKQRKIWRFEL